MVATKSLYGYSFFISLLKAVQYRILFHDINQFKHWIMEQYNLATCYLLFHSAWACRYPVERLLQETGERAKTCNRKYIYTKHTHTHTPSSVRHDDTWNLNSRKKEVSLLLCTRSPTKYACLPLEVTDGRRRLRNRCTWLHADSTELSDATNLRAQPESSWTGPDRPGKVVCYTKVFIFYRQSVYLLSFSFLRIFTSFLRLSRIYVYTCIP